MSISREIKRQLMHASGILAILPIILYDRILATQILALAVIFFLMLDFYDVKRTQFKRTIKQIVHKFSLMEPKEKRQIASDINKFEEFETKIIKRYLLPMSRQSERRLAQPSLLFFLSSLLTLVLFGPEIAIICIIALAVGDSVSAVFGVKFGRKKWSYNPDLSLEGSFAFFVFVSLAVFALATFFPQYAILEPWRLALIAGLVGSLVETTPLVNDNISIPVVLGAVLYLLTMGII